MLIFAEIIYRTHARLLDRNTRLELLPEIVLPIIFLFNVLAVRRHQSKAELLLQFVSNQVHIMLQHLLVQHAEVAPDHAAVKFLREGLEETGLDLVLDGVD